MTPERIAELRRFCELYNDEDTDTLQESFSDTDDFAEALSLAIPELLDEVERLEHEAELWADEVYALKQRLLEEA